MNKLYVGNLAYSTTNQDLSEIFSKFGEILSTNIIKDKFTGNSKGFAFVEMADKSSAQNAIRELNGKPVSGRNMKVNEAIDASHSPRRSSSERYESRR